MARHQLRQHPQVSRSQRWWQFFRFRQRISITVKIAWRCAPCQRMRRIQITQWSVSRSRNLLTKIELRCGWLRWREWDSVGAADRVAATRAHVNQAVIASCHCKISALLPGAILACESGERLDRPQPGLTWGYVGTTMLKLQWVYQKVTGSKETSSRPINVRTTWY